MRTTTNTRPCKVHDPAGLQPVLDAAAVIRGYAHRTPVVTCDAIDAKTQASIHFKCENLQKVGAFKFRGACHAVLSLTEAEAAYGVVAHSSGNHAQALALAAKMRGIPAYIVMPNNAPEVKKSAVAGYGAQITFCEPTLVAREQAQQIIIEKTQAVEIHPYDNEKIIYGQATATLELMEDVAQPDSIIAPVGGGGLLAGTALAARAFSNTVKIYGAEPINANDAWKSIQAGHIVPSENPNTIADGLLTSLGRRNFPLIQRHVTDILTVSEEAIVFAMRFFWERAKFIIEPSAAVALAAVFENPDLFRERRVGVILSGGNIDLNRLPWQQPTAFN